MIFNSKKQGFWRTLKMRYARYLLRMLSDSDGLKRSRRNLRDRLLFYIISIGFPLIMVMLGLSSIIGYEAGRPGMALLNVFTMVLMGIVALLRGATAQGRRATIAAVLFLHGVADIVLFGDFMIGYFYLLSFSIFISVQFSITRLYFSVLINFFTIGSIIMIAHKGWIDIPEGMSLKHILASSISFIFINIMILLLIGETLDGLFRAMRKEDHLLSNNRDKLKQNTQLTVQLQASEQYYRSLFVNSPSPIMIVNLDTRRILHANQAAFARYGLSESEMRNKDIEEMGLLDAHGCVRLNEPLLQRNAQGHDFYIEMKCDDLRIDDVPLKLLVLNDVTDLVSYSHTIETQNNTLRNIAFSQSHTLRAPLANILGLVPLIREAENDQEREDLIALLQAAARRLDLSVQEIVNRCETL